jgi:hypothetical protein
MIERHKDELIEALPEVDLFLGTSETDRLVPELIERGLISGEILEHPGVRVFGGDGAHVRYLKVSEGCDHGCAFCAIPLMRGKHRSFALDELVRESQLLEMQGARELNLVAQDLAHYGRDRRDGVALPELLEALVRETSIPWIRNLYLYSAGITPRLLEVIAIRASWPDRRCSTGGRRAGAHAPAGAAKTSAPAQYGHRPDLAVRTTVIVASRHQDDFRTLCDFRGDAVRPCRLLHVFTAGRHARGRARGRCPRVDQARAQGTRRGAAARHHGRTL